MTDFTALYDKYAGEVFRFALYLCGDRREAEDIAAETFVRVWTSPEPIRMATVKGYLLTIARNLYLQGLRTKNRRTVLDENVADWRPGPQEEAEQNEELRTVMQCLRKLPEADRAALLMRAVHGMPYEEIAQALGISLAAVKVKVHRARLRLEGIRSE